MCPEMCKFCDEIVLAVTENSLRLKVCVDVSWNV